MLVVAEPPPVDNRVSWRNIAITLTDQRSKREIALRQSKRFVLRWLRYMRRIAQVRLTDWAVRTLVVVTFFAYFVAPSRWMFPLVLVCSGVVGVWALLYPDGVLGWAKTGYPALDVNDSSIWWIPRLIGAFFLFFVVNRDSAH